MTAACGVEENSSGPDGTTDLLEAARRSGFYALLLNLERLLGAAPPLLGDEGIAPGLDEQIRFRHSPSYAFSTADVLKVRRLTSPPGEELEGDAPTFEVVTSFLGLTGSSGPAPWYLTEASTGDGPGPVRVRAFLDIFHGRLLSLLYAGLRRYDFPNTCRIDHGDPWSVRLLALLGFDTAAETGAGLTPADRAVLLGLAPLLVEREVGPDALAVALGWLLEDSLGQAQVAVRTFQGQWVAIPPDQHSRLGAAYHRLGEDLRLGRSVFDPAAGFAIEIGPLLPQAMQEFAREGPTMARAAWLVRALLGDDHQCDVILWTAEGDATAAQLGRAGRLGIDAWIGKCARQPRIRFPLPG